MNQKTFLQQIANGTRTTARNGWTKCAALAFDGRNAYSYCAHYPLLFRLDVSPRDSYWIVNDRGYSNTTARHIHHAKMAAGGSYALCVHLARDQRDITPAAIREAAEREIEERKQHIQATREKITARPRYSSVYERSIADAEQRIEKMRRVVDVAQRAHDYQADQNR